MNNYLCQGRAARFEDADLLNREIRTLSLRHRARAAGLLAALGLHPGQEVLLLELEKNGPCIQAQLSEALGVEPPSVTLMAGKLEQAGYVTRTPAPHDRRATVVSLTASGEEVVGRIRKLWCALAEETMTGIPPAELDTLYRLLDRLARNIETRGTPTPRTT